MRHRHHLSSTTHTVEMEQIAELNEGLSDRAPSRAIRASMLGLQGVQPSSGGGDAGSSLPGDALLVRVSFDGPPEFPYVYAHFGTGHGDDGSLTVDLHTEALRKLSGLLGLQHAWGAGIAVEAGPALR